MTGIKTFSLGLTDEVRNDFKVMKDLAIHTRIGPKDRVDRLQQFMKNISRFDYIN